MSVNWHPIICDLTVYSLLFIDLLQTTITTWSTWDFVIENWGDLAALAFPPRTVVAIPLFSSIGKKAVNRWSDVTESRSTSIKIVQSVRLFRSSMPGTFLVLLPQRKRTRHSSTFYSNRRIWTVGSNRYFRITSVAIVVVSLARASVQ